MSNIDNDIAHNRVYTISTDRLSVDIATFGASVYSIRVAVGAEWIDVALGYTSAQQQADGSAYMGATIGRVGNRIAHGKFTLNSQSYSVPCNDGDNSLHGGNCGHDKRLWSVDNVTDSSISLVLEDNHGSQGYPSQLHCMVTYSIVDDRLVIEYTASSTQDTLYAPTNHSYYNLAGQGNGDILDHVLTIHAEHYLAVDSTLIPVSVDSVVGTPFDFMQPTAIGSRILLDNAQLAYGTGYDHCWCVNGGLVATLSCPRSRIVMNVYTDQCALQFYAGGCLDEQGKQYYAQYSGLALETQCYPDNIHNGWGTSCVLKADSQYSSTTQYQFVVRG